MTLALPLFRFNVNLNLKTMAKFIDLPSFDIIEGKASGTRIINVDCIKELAGPYQAGSNSITRVWLIDKSFIDVQIALPVLRGNIEAL